MTRREATAFCALIVALGCGGGGSGVPKCVPGDSKVCSGAAACVGSQVCAADGTYGACVCGGGSGNGGTVSAAAGTSGGGGSGAAGAGHVNDGGAGDAPPPGSDASGADANSSTDAAALWTPRVLGSALALWLDDTVGLGGSTWADQSGRKNDAHAYGALQLFVDKGVANGLDALTLGFPAGAPPVSVGAQDGFLSYVSIALVVKVKSMAEGGTVWIQQSDPFKNGGYSCVISVAGSTDPTSWSYVANCYSPTAPTPTATLATAGHNYADDTFHVVVLRFYGSAADPNGLDNIELQVDKENPLSGSFPGAGVPTGNGQLGANMNSAPADVAEIVGVDGALSTADEANLLEYFKRKFALAY